MGEYGGSKPVSNFFRCCLCWTYTFCSISMNMWGSRYETVLIEWTCQKLHTWLLASISAYLYRYIFTAKCQLNTAISPKLKTVPRKSENKVLIPSPSQPVRSFLKHPTWAFLPNIDRMACHVTAFNLGSFWATLGLRNKKTKGRPSGFVNPVPVALWISPAGHWNTKWQWRERGKRREQG